MKQLQLQKERLQMQIEREKVRLMSEEKYRGYVPCGKLGDFLDQVAKTEKMVYLMSGANGIGKTTSLVNVAANICFPTDNKYFQGNLFQHFPYAIKRIRIISGAETIMTKLIPELEYWFPKGRYKMYKHGKNYVSEIKTDTGFTINILTYDQDPKDHESTDVSVILADEPMPLALYSANISRLRRGGILVIFATLLEGAAWIVPEIVEDKSGDTLCTFIEAEDACIEHGVRGHLEHDQIVKMASKYSPEERVARIFGKPMAYAGLVFKEFNEQVHVIEPFDIDPNNFVVWHSLDIHQMGDTPDSGVWVAIGRDGNYYVVDELYGKWGQSQLANRIKRKNSQYRIGKMVIDPSAFLEDKLKTKEIGRVISLAEDLKNLHNLDYLPASKERHMAVRKTKEAFRFQMQEGIYIKRPKLFIFNTCENLIMEIKTWMYKEESRKVLEYREKYQKFIDKDDHLIEALGRVIVEDPKFEEPKKVVEEMVSDYNLNVY